MALDALSASSSTALSPSHPFLRCLLLALLSHAFLKPNYQSSVQETTSSHPNEKENIREGLEKLGGRFEGGGVEALQMLFSAAEHVEREGGRRQRGEGWSVEDSSKAALDLLHGEEEEREAEAKRAAVWEALKGGEVEEVLGVEARRRARVTVLVQATTRRGAGEGEVEKVWEVVRAVERRAGREERMRARREAAMGVWRRSEGGTGGGGGRRSMGQRVEGEVGRAQACRLRAWLEEYGRGTEEEGEEGERAGSGVKELLVDIIQEEEEGRGRREAAEAALDVACWMEGGSKGGEKQLREWVKVLVRLRAKEVGQLLHGRAAREGVRVGRVLTDAAKEAGGAADAREVIRDGLSAISGGGRRQGGEEPAESGEGGEGREGQLKTDEAGYAALRKMMREDAERLRERVRGLSEEEQG
eukprot:3907842-Rhodomonas_salina.1